LRKIQNDQADTATPQQKAQIKIIETGIDNLLKVHGSLARLINDYDNKLLNVINQHEEDFLTAYKTHMSRV